MMAQQIAAKVRWYEIISAMIADGVDTFVEVGPKTVLKGMMRKIVPAGVKVTALQFDSPKRWPTVSPDWAEQLAAGGRNSANNLDYGDLW